MASGLNNNNNVRLARERTFNRAGLLIIPNRGMSVAPRGTHTRRMRWIKTWHIHARMLCTRAAPSLLYTPLSREKRNRTRILASSARRRQSRGNPINGKCVCLLLCAQKNSFAPLKYTSDGDRVPAVRAERAQPRYIFGGLEQKFCAGLINKSACIWLPSRVGFVSLLGVFSVLKWDARIKAA